MSVDCLYVCVCVCMEGGMRPETSDAKLGNLTSFRGQAARVSRYWYWGFGGVSGGSQFWYFKIGG